MKITKEHGDIYLYFSEDCFIHTINEWSQLIGKWNWYTFTPFHLVFERDYILEGYEMEFMLMGLGFRIRVNDPNGENYQKLETRINKIEKKIKRKKKKK